VVQTERALILVKAVPRPSRRHGETVCCAGVTLDRKWRRLYPIRFRQLRERFDRWDWVSYDWRAPTSDTRKESRHVFEDTITVHPRMPTDERADFLEPLVVESVREAASRGDSLALIRPSEASFRCKPKPAARIEAERAAYHEVANQKGFFDRELAAIEPSPFEFRFSFRDADGWHHHSCHDWETTATYWKLGRGYGRDTALAHLDEMYSRHYPREGLAVALGNMARRPQTWLLLAVIRLDRPAGGRLFP
jgi:hypothetical protein